MGQSFDQLDTRLTSNNALDMLDATLSIFVTVDASSYKTTRRFTERGGWGPACHLFGLTRAISREKEVFRRRTGSVGRHVSMWKLTHLLMEKEISITSRPSNSDCLAWIPGHGRRPLRISRWAAPFYITTVEYSTRKERKTELLMPFQGHRLLHVIWQNK